MPGHRAEIGELWRAVNRGLHDRFRQAFRGCGLPFSALILLRTVQQQPGVTIGELARQTGLVKSQVSKTVEQLVGQGFVEKRADPADQRLVRIYLPESGARGMGEMESRAQAALAGVMDAIPEDDLADVVRGLRILLAALDRANGKSPQALSAAVQSQDGRQ